MDNFEAKVTRASESARKLAESSPGQLAGESLRGLRAMAAELGEKPLSAEAFLLTLVRAVREDDPDEGRRARDVYVAARKRRRRLGVLSLGAGPLAGVANQIADLYCETATVCDVATLHGLDLSDEEIAAHMLVLWKVTGDREEALCLMQGKPPLAEALGLRLRDQAGEQLPDQLTKASLAKAFWEVRATVGDARKAAVGTVVFTGHRTKKVIEKAEIQLGVRNSLWHRQQLRRRV
ncbi:MAG TPA: hypothetical protein VGW80_04675 [Solirubrobacterales bacterium]|nr:hypothetical protein [Solirubrobacterales bacterium]